MGESMPSKMASLRLNCQNDVSCELQKIDSFTTSSFFNSLDSIKSRVDKTLENKRKLEKLKSSLREAEDDFVKVLAVKTRKEAKQLAIRDSISATKARIEELKRTMQVQRARTDEYASIMSQQSLGKENREVEHTGDIQEAISWYNRALGFQVEGGRGVKFTFNNINKRNLYEEYTFTIRHEDDTYTLLACDPQLNGTKELVQELNRTNGLFKFVRTMRERFQDAASLGRVVIPYPASVGSSFGILPTSATLCQESSATVSGSAPVFSVSTNRSESPAKKKENPHEVKRLSKNVNLGRMHSVSPGSVRRSPRFVKNRE